MNKQKTAYKIVRAANRDVIVNHIDPDTAIRSALDSYADEVSEEDLESIRAHIGCVADPVHGQTFKVKI